MSALRGLALLLLLQAAGEALVQAAGWPLPGPVLGLLMLLAALRIPALRAPVAAIAQLLLGHLSLLFVPVGVGVITHLELLDRHGLRLLAVIGVSTVLGLAVTAALLRALLPAAERDADSDDGTDTPAPAAGPAAP